MDRFGASFWEGMGEKKGSGYPLPLVFVELSRTLWKKFEKSTDMSSVLIRELDYNFMVSKTRLRCVCVCIRYFLTKQITSITA